MSEPHKAVPEGAWDWFLPRWPAPDRAGIRRMRGRVLFMLVLVGLGVVRTTRGSSHSTARLGDVPVVVEIEGAVAHPGLHVLPGASSVANLVSRAGGTVSPEMGARLLADGERWCVEQGGAMVLVPPTDPLLVGRRIDLNRATEADLVSIPGVGVTRARAIVADRSALGPFASMADLDRVKGVGPATVEALETWLMVEYNPPLGDVPSADGVPRRVRVNVNTASIRELVSLPGIGPSLAAAILAERSTRGPFSSPQDLQRVKGIGKARSERLAGLVLFGQPTETSQ